MSNNIKTVYKDINGNEHETRAQAKKANRLIDAFDAIDGADLHNPTMGLAAGDPDVVSGESYLIEYARAVVAIYGMKDKAPKTDEAK